jgi:hypothetical protein
MTPLQRSRRLQAGLAALSVVGALGAAVGLGLTTHAENAGRSGGTGPTRDGTRTSPRGSDDGGTGSGRVASHRNSGQTSGQSNPVTPPSTTAPQATTSGS